MSKKRIVWDYELDPDLSWLDQWNTPETYAGNEVWETDGDGRPTRALLFDEYIESYGNPKRHVTLVCAVEEQCPYCHSWTVVESLCGIDFMDWDSLFVGTIEADSWRELENLHQRETARDLLGVEEETRK